MYCEYGYVLDIDSLHRFSLTCLYFFFFGIFFDAYVFLDWILGIYIYQILYDLYIFYLVSEIFFDPDIFFLTYVFFL